MFFELTNVVPNSSVWGNEIWCVCLSTIYKIELPHWHMKAHPKS